MKKKIAIVAVVAALGLAGMTQAYEFPSLPPNTASPAQFDAQSPLVRILREKEEKRGVGWVSSCSGYCAFVCVYVQVIGEGPVYVAKNAVCNCDVPEAHAIIQA